LTQQRRDAYNELKIAKSLPTSLFQREEKYFPLLANGDEGGIRRPVSKD
jgi:hypothetical protein